MAVGPGLIRAEAFFSNLTENESETRLHEH